MERNIAITVENPDDEPPSRPPPPPPPSAKKLSRPKITLSIPEAAAPPTPRSGTGKPMTPRVPPGQIYWAPPKYHGKLPTTPASHVSDPQHPYFNPFMYMYNNKASDFMFKQFEGFKDFTMNTAKSGLSAGEKTAFWFYNKLRTLSKKWFTHLFLTLCLALYSVLGAMMFMALEGRHDKAALNVTTMNLSQVREGVAIKIEDTVNRILIEKTNRGYHMNTDVSATSLIEELLKSYEKNYTECQKQDCENPNAKKKTTWGFLNAMFYAGTIYTTIGMYHIV